MSWGRNSLFPIDFARGTYHSTAPPLGYISLLLRSAEVTPAISETTRETDMRHKIFNRVFRKITKMGLVGLLL